MAEAPPDAFSAKVGDGADVSGEPTAAGESVSTTASAGGNDRTVSRGLPTVALQSPKSGRAGEAVVLGRQSSLQFAQTCGSMTLVNPLMAARPAPLMHRLPTPLPQQALVRYPPQVHAAGSPGRLGSFVAVGGFTPVSAPRPSVNPAAPVFALGGSAVAPPLSPSRRFRVSEPAVYRPPVVPMPRYPAAVVSPGSAPNAAWMPAEVASTATATSVLGGSAVLPVGGTLCRPAVFGGSAALPVGGPPPQPSSSPQAMPSAFGAPVVPAAPLPVPPNPGTGLAIGAVQPAPPPLRRWTHSGGHVAATSVGAESSVVATSGVTQPSAVLANGSTGAANMFQIPLPTGASTGASTATMGGESWRTAQQTAPQLVTNSLNSGSSKGSTPFGSHVFTSLVINSNGELTPLPQAAEVLN